MSNGWGQLTWSEGLWGQQGDQIIELSGLNATTALGGFTQTNIVEVSGAKLEVNDDGIVKIASSNEESINTAKQMVEDIVAEPEIGKIYNGKVVKIVEFGAFVNFMGARDGLLHVSQISQKRVENVTDVLSEGQEVQVKVLDVDRAGKVKLSMKEV